MKTKAAMYHIVRIHRELYPSEILKRTKLMKLLYLADRNFATNNKQTITGLRYSVYAYGPYSDRAVDLIEKANREHLFHQYTVDSKSGTVYKYELCNCPMHTADVSDDSDEVEAIRIIVREYGDIKTRELVDIVSLLPEVESSEKYASIELVDI